MIDSVPDTKIETVSDEYFKIDLKVKMRLLLFIKYKLEKNILHQGETSLNQEDIMENFFSLRFGYDQHLNYLSKHSIDELMVFNMIKSICDDNPNSECDEYLKLSDTLHAGDQQHHNVIEYIYEKLKRLQKLQLDDDTNANISKKIVGILKSKKNGEEKKSDINHILTELTATKAPAVGTPRPVAHGYPLSAPHTHVPAALTPGAPGADATAALTALTAAEAAAATTLPTDVPVAYDPAA